jgi:ubiquitin related modifier 1
MAAIAITVEFHGGLDALFGGRTSHVVPLPELEQAAALGATAGAAAGVDASAASPASAPTMRALLVLLRSRFVRERPELFFASGARAGVRPGILVMVNDCDWELEGTVDCPLAPGDVVCFISTLHGG